MNTLNSFRKKILLSTTLFFSAIITINSSTAFARPAPASGKYTIHWYSGDWGNGRLWSDDDRSKNQQYSKDLGSNKNKLNAFEVCNNMDQDGWFRVEVFEGQGYTGVSRKHEFWTSKNDCKLINLHDYFKNIIRSVKYQGRTDKTGATLDISSTAHQNNSSCHRHWAAGLLSHMVESAGDKFADNSSTINQYDSDFLKYREFWPRLWTKCHYSTLWNDLMNTAELFSVSTTEHDGSTGQTHALVAIADNTAWVTFPGADTDASFKSGYKGGYKAWPSASSGEDVHEYYYDEWTALKNQVSTWLTDNTSSYSNVLITGHSRGGVLAQYMVAELADQLADVRMVVFGSPNAGNKAFIENWCDKSHLATRFYVTHGQYKGIDLLKHGDYEDIITRNKVDVSNTTFPWLNFLAGGTYKPRGMSRTTENYVTGYCDNLNKYRIKASYTGNGLFWQEYAFQIHGMSHYLTALEKEFKDNVDL